MTELVFEIMGRGWGKVYKKRLGDRYEAAIRLERIRQLMRESSRYGLVVTRAHRDELHTAEVEYNAATAAIRETA